MIKTKRIQNFSKIKLFWFIEINKKGEANQHFWKYTKIERNVNLKHLRKTYLTALVNYFRDEATIISAHADIEILKKHYTNNEVIMKANQGFRVF